MFPDLSYRMNSKIIYETKTLNAHLARLESARRWLDIDSSGFSFDLARCDERDLRREQRARIHWSAPMTPDRRL